MLPASPTAARVPPKHEPDVVVIGSGVGGSMVAHGLMGAGLDVLMIERGVPVKRGEHNWDLDAAFELSPYFNMESHYRLRGESRGRKGTFQCVGGPSVFYGGVALRLRAVDFDQRAEIVRDTGAAWPVSYDDLAPYYRAAEEILGVAGRPARHPVDPAETVVHPYRAPALQGPARLIRDAAAGLGLNPSHLPLAIDFGGDGAGSGPCMQCGTCDGYACAVSAKREPSTAVLPALLEKGLRLISNTVAVRILWRGRRIAGVVGIDRTSGRRTVYTGKRYILAAGALGSAHLALASGLENASPAGDWVGRCLMRHCNMIVFGLFPRPLAGSRSFHKQVGIFDHYGIRSDEPRRGVIQSIQPPPPGLIANRLPAFMARSADPFIDRCTGLLAIAEDEPRPENRVDLSRTRGDRYGIPRAIVTHRYTRRDLAARRDLVRVAKSVLRAAGAWATPTFRIHTFSHAVGTLRMGHDPAANPLDAWCRFRGCDNLWVTDGSFMPRSGAVNPSLTIAANALRVAECIAGGRPDGRLVRYARLVRSEA